MSGQIQNERRPPAASSPDPEIREIGLELGPDQTRALRRHAEALGVSLESVLQAVHDKALSLEQITGGPAGTAPFDARFVFETTTQRGGGQKAGEETELLVHALWQELLPGAQLDLDEGFFDAGGNSLLLIRLHGKLETRWPGSFSIAELFAVNTIAAQARAIREKRRALGQDATPKEREDARTGRRKAGGRVAIVGIGLRLPGAQTPEQCWHDVAGGADLVRPLPEARTAEARVLFAQLGLEAPERFREAAWLEDIFSFDPRRFRLAPADAALVDPEQRLFLETAQMALEDAGYGGGALDDKKIAVYVGTSGGSVWREIAGRADPEHGEQVFTLNVPSNVATRLSFLHNWRGPAGLVDTACSSTLAAVHHACLALVNGDCSAALVGGAKISLLPPSPSRGLSIESSTDRTHAFDESADGTGGGEGAIAFFLKTLDQAMADGDPIHAVILGTAINQDGASSGMAAPNPDAQAEVIAEAAVKAGVSLASLSYIEAHGTGTHLGDPIEIEGLCRAFARETRETGFAAIGSGKGNYGHLDACAGALGLLRAVLCLKYDQAPPQPFFRRANPKIDFAHAPVKVCERLAPLADRGTPRRAGVSSFGLSGINVHALIEAPPSRRPQPVQNSAGWTLVGVSAATRDLLASYVRSLAEALRARPEIPLCDVTLTLNCGRDSLPERLVVWARDRAELLAEWDAYVAGRMGGRRLAGTLASRKRIKAIESVACCVEDEGAAIEAARAVAEGSLLAWPPQRPARRVHLPPAPLQRTICHPEWRIAPLPRVTVPILLGPPVDTPEGVRRSLDLHSPALWPVAEHRLGGIPTLVGMGFLPILAEAWSALSEGQPGRRAAFSSFAIRDLSWLRPLQTLSLQPGSASLLLAPQEGGGQRAVLGGRGSDGTWITYSQAVLSAAPTPVPSAMSPAHLVQEMGGLSPAPAFVSNESDPIAVSGRWDCLREIAEKGDVVLALLELPDDALDAESLRAMHPGLLDRGASIVLDRPGLMPAGCAEIQVFSRLPQKVMVHAVRRSLPDGGIEADVSLCHAESGAVCIVFRGLRFAFVGGPKIAGSGRPKVSVVPSVPVWRPAAPAAAGTSLPSFLIVGEGALSERIAADPVAKTLVAGICPSTALSAEALAAIAEGSVSHVLLAPAPGEDLGSRTAAALRLILRALRQPLRLLAIGRGAFNRDGESDARPAMPEAALMAGLVQVAVLEQSKLSARYLELHEQTPVLDILREFAGLESSPGAPMLLDHSGARFMREFVPVPAPAALQSNAWPDSGCCVVSGGTGGLALLLAEELAAGGAVSLALLSRHALPSENDSDASLRRARLEALAGLGLRVRHWSVDVSDRKALSRALGEIRREMGPITAVFHAAGVSDGALLANEDDASFAHATAAKVAGARNLDFLTRDDPLKAFALCGSLNAIEVRAGAGAYAAANAFLDAFAHGRRRAGRPAIVIDWCQIGGVGMAARLLGGKADEYGLTSDEIVRLWRLALASGAPQVSLLYREEAPEKTTAVRAPQERTKTLEAALAGIWSEVLGYDHVQWEDDFYALGGDSLSGMEIVQRIAGELGHSIAISDLLEAGSVKALADRLRGGASIAMASSPAGTVSALIPAPAASRYPLGREQLAVLRAQLSSEGSIAYNLPNGLLLPPDCDPSRLESALYGLVERHEILRTRFDLTGEEPQMEILPASAPSLQRLRVEGEPSAASFSAWTKPFDLESGPPVRFALVEDAAGKPRALLLDIHHSLADGLSLELITRDLAELYAGKVLPPPPFQFKDYAWWSRKGAGVEAFEKAKSYWLERFSLPLPTLDLPTDRARSASPVRSCEVVGFTLPQDTVDGLRRFASARRTTPFTVVLAAWATLLSRCARSDDLVISVPVDARDGVNAPAMPGMMVSLLPLRFGLKGDDTVGGFIERVYTDVSEAMRHRACPLGSLLEALAPPAAPERSLLSEVTLSYMNYAEGVGNDQGSGNAFRLFGIGRSDGRNDLSIFVRDLPGQIVVSIEYFSSIYDRDRIERMGRHFCTLLAALVVAEADASLVRLPLADAEEGALLERMGRGIESALPSHQGLFSLFSMQAVQRGASIAVSDGAGSLSYEALLARAGGVARALLGAGVRPGDLVALHLERSCTAVASILGINAVGAAYLPLDPSYPPLRVSWIMGDAGCRVAIADETGRKTLAEADRIAATVGATSASGERIVIAAETLAQATGSAPRVERGPDSLAYVMYTSGSTGTPKGVRICERGIVRLVISEDYARLGSDDRLLQAAPLAFDASTFELWGALLNGARLCIASRDEVLDPAALASFMKRERISVAWQTTSLFNRQVEVCPEAFSGARIVLTGGETLSPSHLRTAMRACPHTIFVNGYGPTENTTFTTTYRIEEDDLDKGAIPIGMPLPHTTVRVQDEADQLVPIGVWGEIVTGGLGVADGYWKRPDLTAASFVCGEAGGLLYRTGDLGRWRPDGTLEFGGRKDGQIKLRGFRIEKDEIENALLLHPGVKGAAVLYRPEEGELIACVLSGEPAPKASELRAWLLQRLPAYMIPARFVQVSSLPVNANGKLDRERIEKEASSGRPLPDGDVAAGGPPASDAERLVAEVFSEIFARPITDRGTSFLDLGGHSLIIIRAINRIAQRSGVRLSIGDFFASPSVSGLAALIEAETGGAGEGGAIPRAPDDAFPFASHAEERLYLMHGMDASGVAYNMTFASVAGPGFSPEALRTALSVLITRHESLRTGFVEHEGVIVRHVAEAGSAQPGWTEVDLSASSSPHEEALELTRREVARPFDLAKPPLLRAMLVRLNREETLVLFVMHHIIHDGWSSRIFMRELEAAYRAESEGGRADLPPLPIRMRDYAIWQRTRDWSGTVTWWRKILKDAPGRIALPNDRPMPEISSNRGETLRRRLPPEVAEGLRSLAHERGVSMAALGLSLFAALLYRLTRQRDMVIGMGVAGRDRTELEGMIGFFVNVLPIRLQLDETSEFEALLGQTHSMLMAVLDHRDYPFDCLVRDLAPKRSGGRQPLVNVVFEYQHFEPVNSLALFAPAPGSSEAFSRSLGDVIHSRTAKHDLILFYVDQPDETQLVLEYDADIFDAATAERWLAFLVSFATSVGSGAAGKSEARRP